MTVIPNSLPLQLDRLPEYSGWVQYVMGLKPIPKSLEKNAVNVAREFEEDKWGALQKQLLGNVDATVIDADRFVSGESESVAYYQRELYVANSVDVQQAYFELIRREVQALIQTAGHLVELGAGYGSQILKLAALPELKHAGFTAGEYTKAGVGCIELLAARQSLDVKAVGCDLNSLDLNTHPIPSGAVFLTCWTMAYVKGFPRSAMEEILHKQPSVVIHIEPIIEHWSSNSLLQLIWKKYIQINDYNQTLMTELKSYEADGLIKILEERPSIFGLNPLAPVSIVKWVPCE